MAAKPRDATNEPEFDVPDRPTEEEFDSLPVLPPELLDPAAAKCSICGLAMNERTDCGGDCIWCMADAGDPECVEYARKHPRPGSAARASELPAPLTVAALYVETDGCYFGLPGVDPWDEKRDARLYPGPWPVVAHPPCRNWCILSNCRPEIIKGDDGGTFAAALFDVQTFGGILEHPRHSAAWAKYGLPYPSRYGWTQALGDPGYATEIDQGHYGHYVKKPTWLYYVGPEPPQLIWGSSSRPGYKETQTNPEIKGFNGGGKNGRSRPEHSRTPAAFRDLLIAAARSVYSERIVAA